MKSDRLVERHHPLFSPIALISTLVLLIGLGVVLFLTGGRAFNSGDLSAVSQSQAQSGGFDHHADFEDACTQCHAPFQGVDSARCLLCHTTIEEQQAQQIGLHGRLATPDCTLCHIEHQGSEVNLVAQALDQFTPAEHGQLFLLDGAHLELDCAACHQEERYLGTPRTCAGCHAEPELHAGLLGTDCVRCHTSVDWRPARLTVHLFPLDHGGEGTIACRQCHETTLAAYHCTACHAPADMTVEHADLALTVAELARCVDCHPTGRQETADVAP